MCSYSRITLEKIKELLSPSKTNKDFVNLVFHALKDTHQLTFTDSFGEKHLTVFMRGNHDGSKRLNVRRLKQWAEMLCNEMVLNKMQKSVEILVDTQNVTARHEIYRLFSLDKDVMPVSLVQTLENLIKENNHTDAVLLLVLWSVYGQEQIDLLHNLYQKLPQKKSEKSIRLLPYTKPCRPIFKGREDVIEQIHNHFLSGRGFLFLQGMGGIGKSECAKQYAQIYSSDYDTIVFAEYSDSIIKLINDNSVVTLTEPFVSERIRHTDGTMESDNEFYQRKLVQLRLSVDSRTLIVLDNLDQYDKELEGFLAGPYRVLVTTRWQARNVYPHDTIIINEIQNKNILIDILSAYYGKDLSDDKYAESLIDMFQGHTMALELIAKQMNASCLTPEEILDMLKNKNGHELKEGFLMPNYDSAHGNLTSHIQRLFNVADLKETERYILMCLSLLPLSGMEKRAFKKCCGLRDYNSINSLIARSWIRDFDGTLSIHTLVKETVQLSCKPDLLKCKAFLDGLMREFTAVRCYHAVRSDKDVLQKITAHIYNSFPEPKNEELYDFYEWTELILSHCCLYKDAIKLAEKLHIHYQEKYGDNNFRTARMMCRIACGLIHFYKNNEAISLLEQGKSVIKALDKRTVMQELYISDIDFTLSNLYLEMYNEIETEEMLERIEMLCHETLEIRNRLYDDVEEKLWLSCVVPYRNLAWIEIIRCNYEKASVYLEKSLQQCKERGAEFSLYFRNYAQALYENSQHNIQGAIECMNQVLETTKTCFGITDTRITKVYIELGQMYEQNGDFHSAYTKFQQAYEHMNTMPYKNNSLLSLIETSMKRIENKM